MVAVEIIEPMNGTSAEALEELMAKERAYFERWYHDLYEQSWLYRLINAHVRFDKHPKLWLLGAHIAWWQLGRK